LGPLEDEGTAVIPANPAASHVGEYATVEGVVAKVFTSKSGNTFLNIGASYQTRPLPAGFSPGVARELSPLAHSTP
jgi:hypothetical protein